MNLSDNLRNNLTSDERTFAPSIRPSAKGETTAQAQQYSHETAGATQRKAKGMMEIVKAFHWHKLMEETNRVMPNPKVKNLEGITPASGQA